MARHRDCASVVLLVALAGCASDRTSPSADAGDRGDEIDSGPRIDGAAPPVRMFAHTADALYVVDETSFDLELVGQFELPGFEAMNDLAVTPEGALYGITANKLYSIDAATAQVSYLAPVGGSQNVGMTFLPDGSLLAADKPGQVRRIHPTDGAIDELGDYGGGYGTAGDLVAVASGIMYTIADDGPDGTEYDDNVMLTIDPSTGAYQSVVGPIGFGGVFGTAYANGRVYAFTRDGAIIEIEPSSGAGTMVREHPGISFYGAGVSPLVQVE